MLCCLNIGNTHAQIRFIDDDGSRRLATIPTSRFSLNEIPTEARIAAACVVPDFRPALLARGAFLVSAETAPLDFSRTDAASIGADRIANAVQLAVSGPLPAVSIDVGTAVDAEIVLENRVYYDGPIFPGRKMMRSALHIFASQLPDLPVDDMIPPFPATNTEESLRLGTDMALLDAVAGFVARVRKTYGEETRIVLCGGDRRYFLSVARNLEDGGPDFTLRGVEASYRARSAQ